MVQIVKDFTRPVLDIAAWASIGSATVHEVLGRKGAIDSRIKPIGPGLRVLGPALTAIGQPGDNLTLHVALSLARPGDVIVLDVGDYAEQGQFGDVMATAAKAQGIGGLVINGGVRDVASIRQLGFPVFSRSVSIKGTVKESVGAVNTPIVFGGVHIRPGDLILGDEDGLVVVAAEEIDAVLEKSRQREEKEEALRRRVLAGGETLWEISGYRQLLEEKGIAL